MLVLGGAKFITQLLSMLGIMGSVNIMVWHYGMMVGDLVMLVSGIMMFLAYNKAYGIAVDNKADAVSGSGNTDFTNAMALVGAMETDMVLGMISQTAMHLELMANYEAWLNGQIMMLPEEEREYWDDKPDHMEKMDKLEDTDDVIKEDDGIPDGLDLFAFYRFMF